MPRQARPFLLLEGTVIADTGVVGYWRVGRVFVNVTSKRIPLRRRQGSERSAGRRGTVAAGSDNAVGGLGRLASWRDRGWPILIAWLCRSGR